MPLALIALAVGGFGIGLTEFVIAGLLPEVAATFAVDEATAGWLISGYALSVAVGAVGLTAAVTRLPRKKVLLGLMTLFIAGNLVSAIAPTYELMLLGRILAALCHGAFFGIGSVVAASLVAPDKQAGAIATMFTGLTVANVLGVPLGTLVGQHFGWRATFWAITAIGIAAMAAIAALVPALAVILGVLAIIMAAFALTASNKAATVVALVLMGAFGFATVPGLQMRIMGWASHAPTLASGANIAAFNVGNALGAALGGMAISAGLGYTSPLWVGAAMTVAALAVHVVAMMMARRQHDDLDAELASLHDEQVVTA